MPESNKPQGVKANKFCSISQAITSTTNIGTRNNVTGRVPPAPQPVPPRIRATESPPPMTRHGKTTDFTAAQELKLKAGDMRMASMQVSMSELRVQLDQANKQLEDLCNILRVQPETS